MAGYLFDASALVKRYVPEVGSAWVASLLRPAAGNVICVARVTGVEVLSALARRQRSGSIPVAQATTLAAAFRRHFRRRFLLVDVDDALIGQAMNLAEAHALRGYDAVQLAAALEAHSRFPGGPFALISADAELNAAALAEGLAVEDPNQHP